MVHHVGCVARQLGRIEHVDGWTALSPQDRVAAQSACDSSTVLAADTMHDTPSTQPDSAQQSAVGPSQSGSDLELRHMDFWSRVAWDELYGSVNTISVVPEALRPTISDLRT